ncbi:MAG TPA: alpha/beta hydrolase [Stellaceae bacterium]|nr:alpha/beta hydrolase [Stellaceae bacterium]
MTYFLNFRSQNVGGPVVGPYLLQGDGSAPSPQVSVVPPARLPSIFAGKNVLFVTHGFNVSYQDGANALELLGRYLNLASSYLFVGMLWPGDAWIPVVDYPFEGNVAIDCGNRLARFCNNVCAGAQSLSFASHSLGARFVLQAITGLNRRVKLLCMMAGAVNQDCLGAEYAAAASQCDRIAALASHCDDVLKLAFTIGDPFADLLHDDHTPFRAALGYDGPSLPTSVIAPWQIPDGDDYGHGSYLPPGPGDNRWQYAANFILANFYGDPVTWPTE